MVKVFQVILLASLSIYSLYSLYKIINSCIINWKCVFYLFIFFKLIFQTFNLQINDDPFEVKLGYNYEVCYGTMIHLILFKGL